MDIAEKLTQYNKKQVDFIIAMVETGNISKACKIANITETTGFKYLKNGLETEINEIRKIYIEENLKRIEYMSIKAIDTILDILEDKDCSKSIKLNASKSILDYTFNIREQTQIIERLENIERQVKCNE